MKQKDQNNIPDVGLQDRGNNKEEAGLIGESASSDPLPKKNYGDQWWKSKILWFGLCIVFVSLSLGMTFFFLNSYHTMLKKDSVTKAPSAHKIEQPRLTTLLDFMIPFKDRSGEDRFLVCAMVLEPGANKKLVSKEDSFELRKIIYKILKQKSSADLSLMKDKDKLKDEISREINERSGEKSVSNVYFTKFVIL